MQSRSPRFGLRRAVCAVVYAAQAQGVSKGRNTGSPAERRTLNEGKLQMAQTRNGTPPAPELAIRKKNRPEAVVLFVPVREHDACGVGFIVNLKNQPSHRIVANGLDILENLEHRGAVGADPLMGDGAGIMEQIPHAYFKRELAKQR